MNDKPRDPPLIRPLHSRRWLRTRHIYGATSGLLFLFVLGFAVRRLAPPVAYKDERIHEMRKVELMRAPATNILPHVDERFSKWMIPNSTQDQLYTMLQSAPRNPKTGRQFVMASILNEGMIDFSLNLYCSMRLAGIPRNYHVFVALDSASVEALEKVDAQVVLIENSNFTKDAVNNKHLIDFYDIVKMRPTVLHLLCLWGFEVILLDADIVFLENPLRLFNDEADFEVQCDSKVFYRIPTNQKPVPWQVNLGFFKLHPTPVVMALFPRWLEKMYTTPKIQDQSALRKLLKPFKTGWLNNDTVIVDTTSFFKTNDESLSNITVRFLDPMYICNAGGLYQEGRQDWKREAKLRNIVRPLLVHYFHVGYIQRKYNLMKENDMWFVTPLGKCISSQTRGCLKWPLWND